VYVLQQCLICRSISGQHNSCSIFFDTPADRWLISSVALPSQQSPGFHFVSQLLDQIDVGLKTASVDIRLMAAEFPLHGVSFVILNNVDFIDAFDRLYTV